MQNEPLYTTMRSQPKNNLLAYVHTALCGLLMGAADIVPGVSGGTVALLLGVYERLLAALAAINGRSIMLLLRGKWREVDRLIDLRFLLALAAGIASGIVALASLIHYLLDNHQQLTMASFFGLVAASGFVVARQVRASSRIQAGLLLLLAAIAAGLAAGIVTTPAIEPRPGNAYLFGCGAIAICAMILPGISGAYILLLLGMYEEVTGAAKDLVWQLFALVFRFKPDDQLASNLIYLLVFAAGCTTGLLLFSRLLKLLLQAAHNATMAVLAGFMVGSLLKIWPFQATTDLKAPADPQWPTLNGSAVMCLALAAASFITVLMVERLVHHPKTAA